VWNVSLNIEITEFNGLNVYTYHTPCDQQSDGLDVGFSFTFNIAQGEGDWQGLFDSNNGSYGLYTGGFFHSPLDSKYLGYFGIQGGFAFGTPGLSYTRTMYKKIF